MKPLWNSQNGWVVISKQYMKQQKAEMKGEDMKNGRSAVEKIIGRLEQNIISDSEE